MNKVLCVAVTIALTSAAAATPAFAAKDIEKTPYQQTVVVAECNSGPQCILNFPAVTAQTAIHNLACEYETSTPVISYAVLNYKQASGQTVYVQLPVTFTGPGSYTTLVASNMQTLLFIDAGSVPQFFVLINGNSYVYSLQCTISGYTLAP